MIWTVSQAHLNWYLNVDEVVNTFTHYGPEPLVMRRSLSSPLRLGSIEIHWKHVLWCVSDKISNARGDRRPARVWNLTAHVASQTKGHGAFGDVVRRMDLPGNRYAFKKISGAVVQRRGMEHTVQAEIYSLQVCQGSRFVVGFFHRFVAAGDTILVFELLSDLVEAYVHQKLFWQPRPCPFALGLCGHGPVAHRQARSCEWWRVRDAQQ